MSQYPALDKIPAFTRRQDSTQQQITDLRQVALKLGMNDAVDALWGNEPGDASMPYGQKHALLTELKTALKHATVAQMMAGELKEDFTRDCVRMASQYLQGGIAERCQLVIDERNARRPAERKMRAVS